MENFHGAYKAQKPIRYYVPVGLFPFLPAPPPCQLVQKLYYINLPREHREIGSSSQVSHGGIVRQEIVLYLVHCGWRLSWFSTLYGLWDFNVGGTTRSIKSEEKSEFAGFLMKMEKGGILDSVMASYA